MKEVIVLAAFLILWGTSTYSIIKAVVQKNFAELELEVLKAQTEVIKSREKIAELSGEIKDLQALILLKKGEIK